jgi:hypothetical protein
MIEQLEHRRFFSITTIVGNPVDPEPWGYGQVFFDKDHNGKITDRLHDRDDFMSGVRVYVDENKNGVLDKKEPSLLTDDDGWFGFPSRPVEKQAPIRLVLAPGQVQTAGPEDWSQVYQGYGVWSLKRTAFLSLDAGIESPNPAYNSFRETISIPAVRIYVDFNRNGKRDKGEPTGNTTGNPDKPTVFNVTPGDYQLRVYAPEGYKADRRYTEIHVDDRETRAVTLQMSPAKTLNLTFYRDVNHNGRRDAEEKRLAYTAGNPGWLSFDALQYTYVTDGYADYPSDARHIFHVALPPGPARIVYERWKTNPGPNEVHTMTGVFNLPADWKDGMTLELSITA